MYATQHRLGLVDLPEHKCQMFLAGGLFREHMDAEFAVASRKFCRACQ